MSEVTVDIQIYCSGCGAGICSNATGGNGRFDIEPCERCLEAAKKEGLDEGYDNGYEDGKSDAEAESAKCPT